MTENVTFSVVVLKEGKLQIAWSPELEMASQGKNVEDAIRNLKEAVELYFEDEDAKIPSERSAILTTVCVRIPAKTDV